MNFFKPKKLDLEKIYEENKFEFELLLIKDFVGYIPKDIQEPALNIFKEYGEVFERWTLWQSWYVNRKVINDPLKITFYNGMMVYLKVLNTMARTFKKNAQPQSKAPQEEVVATSFLESALEDLDFFRKNVNKKPESNQSDKDEKPESSTQV
jgi:hypothetical protein